jgi:arabinogalactan endo-1,4-beta-galactosidase
LTFSVRTKNEEKPMRQPYALVYVVVCAALLGCSNGSPATAGGSGGSTGGLGGLSGGSDGSSGAGQGGSAAGGQGGTGGLAGTGGLPGGGGRAAGGAPGAGGATIGSGGATGGGGAAPFTASYFIGADISRVQTDAPGTLYTDTDGQQKDFLAIMKGHGFNYMRVRTFVDPRAADGNSKTAGFYDIPHTVAFGKRIKDAGLGFLLDFHYSDNWADPGKQCVPVAWQAFTTNAQLATAVYNYTTDSITQLVAGGARPDMVAVGNEITPGMLFDVCDAGGLPTGTKVAIGGSTANWTNLGALLKAGIKGVKDVDPTIQIQLHLDRADNFGTNRTWVNNAIAQGVAFDVLGESSYALYQCLTHATDGMCPSLVWTPTYTQLATTYPNLKFVAAEYGPLERELNDVLYGLPNRQGLGTFYWEPTHSGADNAGHVLFVNRVAQPDLLLYDAMKAAYASRL